jgi:3-deoxy-D-manno-octulosonic-acid transferase
MIFRLIYTVIGYLALPLIIIILNLPKKHKPSYGWRFPELLGFFKFSCSKNTRIWIHSVSVGETIAAIPFIKKYHEMHPDVELVVTTTTTTGAQQLKKLNFVTHIYAPLDYPHAVYLFLKKVRPKVLFIMERELWPNWLNACQKRQIPVILLNARLSERSCQKYQKMPSVFYNLLGSNLSMVLCQNSKDESRFHRLNVLNTKVTGSMKYDLELNPELCRQGTALKNEIGTRPVWIAASTHETEDEIFLLVHKRLLDKIPNALLFLVPRHPERFDSVAQKIKKENLTMARRSTKEPITPETQVYLGDTLGELILLYQASDVVFIGGSLADIGGHNPIEAAALSKPLLIGPYYYNFEEEVLNLNEAKGLEIISENENISQRLTELLLSPDQAKAMGKQAFNFIESNHGAIDKTIKYIDESIEI